MEINKKLMEEADQFAIESEEMANDTANLIRKSIKNDLDYPVMLAAIAGQLMIKSLVLNCSITDDKNILEKMNRAFRMMWNSSINKGQELQNKFNDEHPNRFKKED